MRNPLNLGWIIFGCTMLVCFVVGAAAMIHYRKMHDIHKAVRMGSSNSERGLLRITTRVNLALVTFQRWWNVHVLKIPPPPYPPPPPKGSNEDYYQDKDKRQ